MKKIFLILAALLLLIGCGSDEEKKTETSEEAKTEQSQQIDTMEYEQAAEVKSAEPFELAYVVPQGEKLRYKLTSVATTNQKIIADSVVENEVSQTSEYIFALESKGQKNNNTVFDVIIESLTINANYNGEIITYDSKEINDKETNLKFAEYSSLPNNKFQISINRQGRIGEVQNIDDIVKSYLAVQEVQSITDEERAQLETQLKDQALQPLIQQMFRYMPEEPTRVDSSWDLKYNSPMGLYTLTNTATSTLRNIVKKDDVLLARIDTDLSVTYKGDGFTQQGDVTYQFEKPEVTGNAVTYFNLDRNIIQKSELTTRTEINVLVTATNPDVGTQTATRTDLSVNRNFVELL